MKKDNKPIIFMILIISITAVTLFLSNGIFFLWPPAWISAIPILWFVLQAKPFQGYVIAFIAYFLGFTVHVIILRNTVPLPLVFLMIFIFSIYFAFTFLLTKYFYQRVKSFLAVLIFPVFWTIMEYILFSINPNGTWGSIAYSQMDFLPIIQIASLTGLWGINFIITLFASGVTLVFLHYRNKRYIIKVIFITVLIILSSLIYGFIRLQGKPGSKQVHIGLISLNQDIKQFRTKEYEEASLLINKYIDRINGLALQGAEIIVLPEKIVGITKEYQDKIITALGDVAKNHNIVIVVGVNIIDSMPWINRAWGFLPSGELSLQYDKHYLVPGWEKGKYIEGDSLGLLHLPGETIGVMICKDNDFPSYARQYGSLGIGLMLSPAWDFIHDAQYHTRMAIMRGIENGYALARSTKEGISTLSDQFGRIIISNNSGTDEEVVLLGSVYIGSGNTFYGKRGDLFVYLLILFLIIIIVTVAIKKGARRK